MRHKKVLWISRHALWKAQINLIKSLHGKKVCIEQRSVRFESYEHFTDYLDQHIDSHYIYAVVPESWKSRAIDDGYPLGTIHRPEDIKDQGKKRRIFKIEYHLSATEVKKKHKGKPYGTKGFKNC